MRGASEVTKVGALGIVELQRARERVEHAVGDPAHVPALQARQYGTLTRQDGDLPRRRPGTRRGP